VAGRGKFVPGVVKMQHAFKTPGLREITRRIIGALASAARHIDEVVGFIRTIAGQTNLLALNATIEASGAALRWSHRR